MDRRETEDVIVNVAQAWVGGEILGQRCRRGGAGRRWGCRLGLGGG